MASPARFVFISAHQDDESLSMGAAIREHVAVHGPAAVAVVLVSTGEASGARRVFRDAGYVPVGSSRVERRALTRREFVASRDAEFYEACRELGVPHGGIFMPGFTLVEDDGSVYRRGSYTTASVPRLARLREGWTGAAARRFVDAVVAHFGPAHFKTLSWADPSQDHRLVGEALRDTRLPTASRRFYYPPYQPPPARGGPVLHARDASKSELPAVEAAGRAYGRWDPERGRFSVGWFSIAAAFGGPAAELLRCPSRVPPATDPAECGRAGVVRPPGTPLFGVGRTLMHL